MDLIGLSVEWRCRQVASICGNERGIPTFDQGKGINDNFAFQESNGIHV